MPSEKNANQLAADAEPVDHDALCASFYDANRFDPEAACNCRRASWKALVALVGTLQKRETDWKQQVTDAEAQVAALTQERDRCSESHARQAEKLEAATVALATTRQALAHHGYGPPYCHCDRCRALAAEERA